MRVVGKIYRSPIIKEKVIFSGIQEDKGSPIQLVLFRLDRPAELSTILSNAKIGDEYIVEGRLEKNPFNNEPQITIDNIESLGTFEIDINLAEVPNEF